MSTAGPTATQSSWRGQQVNDAAPANWDQQLDSLLSDLDCAAPGAGTTTSTTTTTGGGSLVPASSSQSAAPPDTTALGGNEDFHERQEYTSPDQRTRTVEERSRRTARTNDGIVTQQTFKSQTSSSHPAGNGPAQATNGAPQIELDGTDIPDITTIFPDANAPLAPGQKRIIKYDVRKTHQRSVSPQPAPVSQLPAPVPSQRALPPPVAPKPRAQTPQMTLPPASPLVETYRNYSSVNDHTSGKPPTLGRPTAASPEPLPVPPAQPGSNTTINYHIYNYGATGPDGLPVEGVPAPGAPPTNVNTIERHETREQTMSSHPGSPAYPPAAPYTPAGRPQSPPARPGPSTNTIERHETREQTMSSHPGSPAYPQAAPYTPAGRPQYPPARPEPNTNTVERYETRQYTSQTAGSPHGPPQQPPQTSGPYSSSPAGPYSPPPGIPGSKTSTIERYETREQTRNTSAGRPPSPYENPPIVAEVAPPPVERYLPTCAPSGGQLPQQPPSESYHTRLVSREVERTHTTGGGTFPPAATTGISPPEDGALVPSYPQDATYPDGPVRRDLTPSQAAPPSDAGEQVTSPSKAQPGVYYPPEGLNADHKWKSSEKSKNGNTKSKFEAGGRYKAKGGSKQKEDKGGKTIPICLPLCGGAACSIM